MAQVSPGLFPTRVGAIRGSEESSLSCEHLAHPDYFNLGISVIILVGLLLSYLPQHYRIINRRSAEGISPFFVLLGVTSATSSFANIFLLPGSQEDVGCCRVVDALQCAAGLLGIGQFAVQFLSFVLVLFLSFSVDHSQLSEDGVDHSLAPSWHTAKTVALVCLAHGVGILSAGITLIFLDPAHLGALADLLGLEASLLAIVQYAPQIWTTYKLKHVGSLSIPMMCIQTPGGFLFAYSLHARLGLRGWSSWGIILVTATSQAVLLSLALFYQLRHRYCSPEADATAEAPEAEAESDRLPSRPHQPLFYRYRSHEEVEARTIAGKTRKFNHSNDEESHDSWSMSASIDHRIYHPRGIYDPDMPGPYTAHASHYADTPEEYDALLSREEAQATAEDEPLVKRNSNEASGRYGSMGRGGDYD